MATDTPFPTSSSSPATPAPSGTGNVSSTSSGSTSGSGGNGSSAAGGQAGDVLSRVVQGAHSAIDRMAETAAPAVQRVQDGVQSASDTLSRKADDARELGDEWAESLRCTVRDHPLAAVATALAVGVLIARLSR